MFYVSAKHEKMGNILCPVQIIYYTKYLIRKQDIEGFNVKMNNVFGVDKVDSYKETETYSE